MQHQKLFYDFYENVNSFKRSKKETFSWTFLWLYIDMISQSITTLKIERDVKSYRTLI